MNKKFVKSVTAGILGLSLTAACSMIGGKESHKCSGNKCSSNGCKSKKSDKSHKCSSNGCSSKKK